MKIRIYKNMGFWNSLAYRDSEPECKILMFLWSFWPVSFSKHDGLLGRRDVRSHMLPLLRATGDVMAPRVLNRSLFTQSLGLYSLQHRSLRVQSWGSHLVDPPRALSKRRYMDPLGGHVVFKDTIDGGLFRGPGVILTLRVQRIQI